MIATEDALIPLSARPRARRSDPTGPLNYAIIGVSGYAGILLDCLEPLIEGNEVRLVAATVLTRSKAAERCDRIEQRGGKIYQDWQTMIDVNGEHLDCLIVPTGIQDHCKMAMYALERDLNVFLEKPIAATLAEAQAILQAAERSQAGLILGYQDIYTESTHAIKELLHRGGIGTVKAVSVVCLWPRGDDYFARNSWAGRLRIGNAWVLDSPVNNAMGHFVNLPLFWLGDSPMESAEVVQLTGSLQRTREVESFDTAALHMETTAGIPVYFHGSHSCESPFGPEIRIVGSGGEIHWVGDQHYTIKTDRGIETVPIISTPDARRLLMRKTAGWLLKKSVIVSTLEQGMQQTRVVHLLHSGLKIETVADEHIGLTEGQRVLHGLDVIFKDCFHAPRLLSPKDAPWATPSQSVAWQDVRHLSEPAA